MFKFKKLTAIFAAAALACTAFVGCGNNNANSGNNDGGEAAVVEFSADTLNGTWTISGVSINGEELSIAQYAEVLKTQGMDEASITLITDQTYSFGADGNGSVKSGGVEGALTYTVDGNNVTISANGTDSTLTYDSAKGVLAYTDPTSGGIFYYSR